MNSPFLVSLMLLVLPYMPWIIFSGAVERPVAAGMRRLAQYGALSQISLLALRLAGPFSWASALVALYLMAPFHLGLFFSSGLSGVKGDWQEKLAVILIHLTLLLGQAGALLLAWS